MEEASDRSFLSSPRNQRRLLAAALVVLAIGVATLTFVFFRNTGDPTETFSNEPADIYKPQKTTKIDPAARVVAGKFIKTAVARENLAAAYDLVTPELRQGLTRKQWATGNIPIVFFPAGDIEVAAFKVDRSYANEVVWEVYIVPKPGSGQKSARFYVGLERADEKAPWKVNYWAPNYQVPLPNPG